MYHSSCMSPALVCCVKVSLRTAHLYVLVTRSFLIRKSPLPTTLDVQVWTQLGQTYTTAATQKQIYHRHRKFTVNIFCNFSLLTRCSTVYNLAQLCKRFRQHILFNSVLINFFFLDLLWNLAAASQLLILKEEPLSFRCDIYGDGTGC